MIYFCHKIMSTSSFVARYRFCPEYNLSWGGCFVLQPRKIQFSIVRFLFRNHVQVFSVEISPICLLKYSYSCFSLYYFATGPGDLRSIPGRVIPKTLKWYLMLPCLALSNIRYVSRVKWSNPGKRVAPSAKPRCSSYRKGSLRVALD